MIPGVRSTALAALLTTLPILGVPTLRAQDPGERRLLEHVDPRFQAYAPDPQTLDQVVDGLETAHRRFTRFFGEPPPSVAVVVYRSEAERLRHSEEELGMPVYDIQAGGGDRQRGFTIWGEAGAVLTAGPGDLPVVAALVSDRDTGVVDLRQGDVITAVDGEPLSGFRDFLDRRQGWPEGRKMELSLARDRERVTERFHFEGRSTVAPTPSLISEAARFRRGLDFTGVDPSFVAHESAHEMLSAFLGADRVPAWFHEGFASLSESEPARRLRVQNLKTASGDLLPWSRLFEMEHPASEARRVSGTGAMAVPGRVLVIRDSPTMHFYGQSMSILAFLTERAGPSAVSGLAQWLAEGNPPEDYSVILGEGNTVRLAELEDAWKEWVSGHAG